MDVRCNGRSVYGAGRRGRSTETFAQYAEQWREDRRRDRAIWLIMLVLPVLIFVLAWLQF